MGLTNKVLAEFVGTFALVFFGGGSILLSERYPHFLPGFFVPLTWGLTVSVMILAVGSVSGAHFNPAVTLAFAVTKRIPHAHVFVYWISQFFGGLTAVGLLAILQKR